jgi:hypothetical protein
MDRERLKELRKAVQYDLKFYPDDTEINRQWRRTLRTFEAILDAVIDDVNLK